MFGSTTERVLRQTTIPVVITPAHDPGPESLEDWRASVKQLLVPVDFSQYSERQTQVARGLAEALGASILLVHVLEPLSAGVAAENVVAAVDALRRTTAQTRLDALLTSIAPPLQPATMLLTGDPAREIARLAKEHSIGAIVMGLHSAIGGGPRMGTVTYRVLCEAPALVVAWPPSRSQHRLQLGATGLDAPQRRATAQDAGQATRRASIQGVV
jgi:universal stress protein A